MRADDKWRMLVIVGMLAIMSVVTAARYRPNVIFALVDDAGWADFETNDPHMRTPNIEKLKEEGIFLNQSYANPMCTPTRAALMSSRYPHTLGLQDVMQGHTLHWLNENLTLLPQEMKKLGYDTHMLGKWHLGFCHRGLTPLGRGFDTFYGFWLGSIDSYYNHTKKPFDTYTWRDGDNVDLTAKGKYQTDLLNDRAVEIVENATTDTPFFMYLSYGAPHTPLEVPQHYIDTYCSHVNNKSRQLHCGMMAAVDEGIGRIRNALKKKHMDDKTAILFMSDNGGPIPDGSVNWPLRGSKKSLYDGGIRAYTILKESRLTKTNITWPGLAMHIDWYPTLVSIAGGRINRTENDIHGKNLWHRLRKNDVRLLRRDFIIVNDFKKYNHSVIRYKNFKLLGIIPSLANTSNNWKSGLAPGWYPPYQLLGINGTEWENEKMKKFNSSYFELYDLSKDPQERDNLATKKPNRVKTMRALLVKRLNQYKLHPWDHNPKTSWKNRRNGAFVSCWCEPAGLVNTPCTETWT